MLRRLLRVLCRLLLNVTRGRVRCIGPYKGFGRKLSTRNCITAPSDMMLDKLWFEDQNESATGVCMLGCWSCTGILSRPTTMYIFNLQALSIQHLLFYLVITTKRRCSLYLLLYLFVLSGVSVEFVAV